jgi:hypothetical protein
MRSTTRKLRKVLVKAIIVGSLVTASAALADGSGSSTRPGGGYVEPVVFHPNILDGEVGAGGGGFPMHMASF